MLPEQHPHNTEWKEIYYFLTQQEREVKMSYGKTYQKLISTIIGYLLNFLLVSKSVQIQ